MDPVTGPQVTVERAADGTVVARLAGEIDLSTAPEVESRLRAGIGAPPDRLAFDLTDLVFMDSSGIAVLLRIGAEARSVVVRNPSQVVGRVIEATGLSDVLVVEHG
jgi:anti-anti-sigma factor